MMCLVFAAAASQLAFAAPKPCENHAKYAAIKAYKAEVGAVQGSDGIEYVASLLKQQGPFVEYKVTISDNNEDGETWDVNYRVRVQVIENSKCKILSVKRTD